MLVLSVSTTGTYGFSTANGVTAKEFLAAQPDGKLPEGAVMVIDEDHPFYERILNGPRHFKPVIQQVNKKLEEPVLDEKGRQKYDEQGTPLIQTVEKMVDDIVDVVDADPPDVPMVPEDLMETNLNNLKNSDYRVIRALEKLMPKLYAVVGIELPTEWNDSAFERQGWRDNVAALEQVVAGECAFDEALERTRSSR